MLLHFRSRLLSAVQCVAIALLTMLPASLRALSLPVTVLLQINRVAGSPTGVAGSSGNAGSALLSLLNQPEGVAIDGGGNLYIADTLNNRIQRIDAATGVIATVAGNGQQGYGGDNGPAVDALLDQPVSVLADPHGNLYIADTENRVVRFVSLKTGIITTVAGTPSITIFDPNNIGDGGPATQAELDSPAALALDSAGNLFIADAGDNRVREVYATTGTIATVAGTGTAGYTGDNILATRSELNGPTGIAVDAAGNLYIADSANNLIRAVNALSGVITTVAGVPNSVAGYNGDNILATQAKLNFPTGIVIDFAGQISFSDRENSRIRKIDAAGTISTLAGNGTAGLSGDGNLASNAEVDLPGGLALDDEGDLYLADSGNNVLRLVSQGLNFPAVAIAATSPATMHTIFLGLNQSVTLSTPTVAAAEIQTGAQASTQPQEFSVGSISGCSTDGTTANPSGSICAVPVTFTPGYPGTRTGTLEFAANSVPVSLGLYGIGLGPQAVVVPGIIQTILYSTDMFNGTAMTEPERMAVDPAGNVYVADPSSNVVWSLQNRTGASPTIVAGGGSLAPAQANGGQAVDAALNQPNAVALDAAGNLYIAETGANLVRKVDLATGIITTVAGTGTAGYSGDQAAATSATLNGPAGIAANAAGDLFIADTGNNVIRRVYALSGTIATVVGNGTAGYTGDGGYALQAELHSPHSVAIDPAGRLYIADTGNNVIRAVDPVTDSITTVAGNGTAGFAGDGAAAVNAELNAPAAVAADAAGNLYIADTGNARVRKLYSQSGTLVTLAGSALIGDEGDGGPANAAALTAPAGVAVDSLGQVLISDPGNDTVRRVSTNTPTLDFGSETVGAATAAQTDFLSNIGNRPLAIAQFPAAPIPVDFPMGPDAAQCSVGNLVAGSLCDLSFIFQPTVPGPLTEDGWITDNSLNATGAQQVVPMTGNGVASTSVATTTTVVVNPATAIYGTPVHLTANVSSTSGPVIGGDVEFSINGIEVGAAALSGSGTATVTLPAAPTGSDIVTATFAAQGNYLASSGTANLMVTPANSQISLTASATQIRLGQNVIFTASVASITTGMPTGTVVFLNGSAQIGEALLSATGQAILNTQNLPPGTDTITAQYQGDGNFQPSTSSSVTVTVTDDTLTMTASPTLLTISTGKTGQTTLTLTPKNGFAGTVSLSCAGLIQGAACQFSSPSVMFDAQTQTPQSITLVIDPNTVVIAGFRLPAKASPALRLSILLLGLGAILLPFFSRRRSVALGWGRMFLAIFCVGLGFLSGCANLTVAAPVSDAITVQASMPSSGVLTTAQLQVYMAQ